MPTDLLGKVATGRVQQAALRIRQEFLPGIHATSINPSPPATVGVLAASGLVGGGHWCELYVGEGIAARNVRARSSLLTGCGTVLVALTSDSGSRLPERISFSCKMAFMAAPTPQRCRQSRPP